MKRILSVLLLGAAAAWAQAPAPAPAILSPEVQSDNTVTFRFRAPNAREVLLSLEGAKPVPMQKDDRGVWSVATGPLTPDFYGYTFMADGVGLIDPSNPLLKPNLLHTQSQVHVPGPASLPWEWWEISGISMFIPRLATIPERSRPTRCSTCCTVSAMTPAGGPP